MKLIIWFLKKKLVRQMHFVFKGILILFLPAAPKTCLYIVQNIEIRPGGGRNNNVDIHVLVQIACAINALTFFPRLKYHPPPSEMKKKF